MSTRRTTFLVGLALTALIGVAGCGLPQDHEPQRFALPARDEQVLREPITTTTLGPVRTVPQTLYFARIAGDDTESLVPQTVPVKESGRPEDVPKDVMDALLGGISAEQRDQDLRTFVPENAKVDSVTVRDGVATVNFSSLGNAIESRGQRVAAAQIVFTLTELPGVDKVLILNQNEPANVPLGNTESSNKGEPIGRDDYAKFRDALNGVTTDTTDSTLAPS